MVKILQKCLLEDLSTFLLPTATYNHHKINLFKPNCIKLLWQTAKQVWNSTKILHLNKNHKVNSLLHFHNNACNIYYTADSTCNSAIQRELTAVFPWQQWLCEQTTMLHYLYTAYFVKYSHTCILWLHDIPEPTSHDPVTWCSNGTKSFLESQQSLSYSNSYRLWNLKVHFYIHKRP